MPRPFPKEFRDDVVRVARNREPGVTIKQVAADFGVSESCLTNWLTAADREDGLRPGPTAGELAELREAKKRIGCWSRRTRCCAARRRACRRRTCRAVWGNDVPARPRAGRRRIPVTVTCRVLKIARQPYYRWLAHPVTDTEWVEAHRADALFDAHVDDPEFGHRFLADEAREQGEPMADRTAWRICGTNGWWSAFGKPRGRNGKKKRLPGTPAFDDLVHRCFTAPEPNVWWLVDITEHATGEGKLCCCAIKDVYSNRIVGYSIDSRVKARLAVQALGNAVARRAAAGVDVAGCIVHADRGSQFRSRKFHQALARHGMVGSMGKVASAADNAAMESFFSLLQKNVLNRQPWRTRDELRIAIVAWIERTYHHRRRRQDALGRLTPIEHEAIMTPTATQAA